VDAAGPGVSPRRHVRPGKSVREEGDDTRAPVGSERGAQGKKKRDDALWWAESKRPSWAGGRRKRKSSPFPEENEQQEEIKEKGKD